jgi:two-component system, OmpR family, response regulator ChvI
MARIAIIEDDPPTSNTFATWLRDYDPTFELEQLNSRAAAEAAISTRTYDLIVLDIRLGTDSNAGVGLIHDLSKRQNCPVIVVSGMPADIYRGIMYQLEAWDYLTKPVDQAALIAVVRNALKEKPAASPNGLPADQGELPAGLELNPLQKKHPVWRGQRLVLPLTAQRILYQIARSRGRPASFAELVKVMPYAGTQGAVKTHISTIRTAFKAVDPTFNKIVNVPLVGYLWQD